MIAEAAQAIRDGKLVAFPTETVYGLGANALDANAVERIFATKGRPKTSPLIVHVASVEMARELGSEWSAVSEMLARRFWPGPLTLVVPKNSNVPDIVTAGLGSVGLRIPAHPMALELLRAAGVPIAAPSANKFTELSPTRAEHVLASFGHTLIVLDGGPCTVGIESTVFDVAGMRILRPGMVSRKDIEQVIGPVESGTDQENTSLSPGLHPKHYQPRTLVILGDPPESGRGAYLWRLQNLHSAQSLKMPNTAQSYAATLYSLLHDLDAENHDWIAIEPVPEFSEWDGIRDRLTRATAV